MVSDTDTILKFMSKSQAECFCRCLRGVDQSYFYAVLKRLSKIIKKAPALYETDGKGDKVKPVLHYFWGNVDIYVTEIDKESNEHFGYTSLGYGYLEAGYIDLDYVFESIPLINLDFNFKPLKIAEYRKMVEG